MVENRIENRRYEKNIKLFKWLAIASLILIVARLSLDSSILTNGAKLGDLISTLFPLAFWFQYRITAKKWGGQFFEWRQNEIEFKSRKYERTTIPFDSIKEIDIRLDIIEIKTVNQLFEINIEDYTEYEDRLKIKKNFELVKNKTKHNNG